MQGRIGAGAQGKGIFERDAEPERFVPLPDHILRADERALPALLQKAEVRLPARTAVAEDVHFDVLVGGNFPAGNAGDAQLLRGRERLGHALHAVVIGEGKEGKPRLFALCGDRRGCIFSVRTEGMEMKIGSHDTIFPPWMRILLVSLP